MHIMGNVQHGVESSVECYKTAALSAFCPIPAWLFYFAFMGIALSRPGVMPRQGSLFERLSPREPPTGEGGGGTDFLS